MHALDTDIATYLVQHQNKELLRFLTCGSVDDGKSTLIGRLLHDSDMVYEDQLKAAQKDSKKFGTTGEKVDLALLVDGLKAEREQGITIDVAYRYFSTAKRKFIIADCPGHEQYTRNMATGASTCDLAIILVDAERGVLPQTRRHSFIVSLLGIKHLVVAVNKMDLVGYSEAVFNRIVQEFAAFASKLETQDIVFLPISARDGDNVVTHSQSMPWYKGTTLLNHLETVHIASDENLIDLRLPVQYVLRPNAGFRGFAGTLASGILRKGDKVLTLPAKKTSRIKSIVDFNGERDEARAPMAVTVTLEDEVDVSRGDMLVHPNNQPRIGTELDAMVVWLAEEPLSLGKEYLLKHTTRTVSAKLPILRYAVDVNTVRKTTQSTLALNQIGRCAVATSQPLFFDAYRNNKDTGAFILIDRLTNNTVGAGMILDRAANRNDTWELPAPDSLQETTSPVSADERKARMGQSPVTVLFTGLPGSGKTSLAYAVERKLFDRGNAVTVLDGQNIRLGLSKDLDFSGPGRSENLRRAAAVSALMNDAGLIVLAAFVAPSDELRGKAKELVGKERFVVVHLVCPVDVCKARAPSDLYARAERGELLDFPGVSAPYDAPSDADLVLDTSTRTLADCAEEVLRLLESRHAIT